MSYKRFVIVAAVLFAVAGMVITLADHTRSGWLINTTSYLLNF